MREAGNSHELTMQCKLAKFVIYKNVKLFDSELMRIYLPLDPLISIKRASFSQIITHTSSEEPVFMDKKLKV